MKALEKDLNAAAYERQTVGRWTSSVISENEPVIARPPSQLYRLQKMVRRNKIIFGAVAAVLVALLMGLGSSTWLFFMERKSRLQVERGQSDRGDIAPVPATREKIALATSVIAQRQLDRGDLVGRKSPTPARFSTAVKCSALLGEEAAIQGQPEMSGGPFQFALARGSGWKPRTTPAWTAPVARWCFWNWATGRDTNNFARHPQRFAGTPDPLSAERAVKNCFFLPANGDDLTALVPFTEIAKKSIKRLFAISVCHSWRCAPPPRFLNTAANIGMKPWNGAKYTLNSLDDNNLRGK